MQKELSELYYSTEEMCAGIEKVNSMRDVIKKLVVISMDVEKLFPSLVAIEVARVVKEEFLAAKLEIEVDNIELGLHLAVTMKRELYWVK